MTGLKTRRWCGDGGNGVCRNYCADQRYYRRNWRLVWFCQCLSLESIFGYVLAPLAWIMGVDWSDANLAGSLIGQKLAINEFVAYLSFSPYLQTGGTLEVKTIAIISFALCGFANFGSIGVVVGAFSAISPKRAPEIAQLGFTGAAAATLQLMSATIAGFFIGLA